MVPLGLALKSNHHLQHLKLSYNPIGDEGAHVVVLRLFTMRCTGVVLLCSGLKWNGCLTTLELVCS